MNLLKQFIIIFLSASILFSCMGNGIVPDNGEAEFDLTLQYSEVSFAKGYMFVDVEASDRWNLELEFEDGDDAWATLSQTEGSGSKHSIVLSYDAYTGSSGRTLLILLNSDGMQVTRSLYQGRVQSSKMKKTADVSWLELPETQEWDGLEWGVVRMKSNPKMRNYSYYWDYDALVAHWVAYPLNQGLIGSGGRSEAWGSLDPNLPQSMQPILYNSWGVGWLDRGHQIPSADRLNDGDNQATFYGTNMTPQIGGGFNQSIWKHLEEKVRSWCYKCDTLYVVTGCVVRDGSIEGKYNTVGGYVNDNNDKRVAVPTAYYKAVLRYSKQSSTYGYGGYCGAAIYLEHKRYSSSAVTSSMLISIDELEDILGMDLFVNLPKVIGEEMSAKVEAQDPQKVGIWK